MRVTGLPWATSGVAGGAAPGADLFVSESFRFRFSFVCLPHVAPAGSALQAIRPVRMM